MVDTSIDVSGSSPPPNVTKAYPNKLALDTTGMTWLKNSNKTKSKSTYSESPMDPHLAKFMMNFSVDIFKCGFHTHKLYNVFTGMIKLGAMFNFPKGTLGNQIRADLAL